MKTIPEKHAARWTYTMRCLLPLCLIFVFVSCMEKPEGKYNPPEPGRVEKVEDLKIVSLSLDPMVNDPIYGKVEFRPDAAGTTWSAEIADYRTDLSKLKLTFDVVADRVTVDGVEQTSGQTVNDLTRPVVFRLHTAHDEFREFAVTLTNPVEYSGYPLLAIITDGAKAIDSKENWVAGRVVLDPQQSGCEPYSGEMQIKGRGHNTWGQPKKPYTLKLIKQASLMGMHKHKRWVLLANAGDRTLMRNRIAYHLGRLTGLPWTSDTRYVEVLLNGRSVGNYLLTEQIRIDKDRVNITEALPGMMPEQAGYLLEFDRYKEENYFYTQRRQLPVNIKDPDGEFATPAFKEYISAYIDGVEEVLYGGEAVDAVYRDLIDIDTFIDWWIMVELTENRDTKQPGSCYMYKDAGGKLCMGPLWDFDLTTFQGSTREFMQYDYETPLDDPKFPNRSLWFKRLFTDPVFRARAKERWQQFKPAFEAAGDFIDAEKAALAPSAARNWALWTINPGSNKDETLTWDAAVERLKANYYTRLQWLDNQIAQW